MAASNRTDDLLVIDYENLPDGPWNADAIGDGRNAMGVPPQPILYLWVFERPDSLCAQLVTHGWAKLGPTHLLVGPDQRVPPPMIKSPDALDKALSAFGTCAGHYHCPALTEFEVSADYVGYPINYLWCSDPMWKPGFRALAERCRYFVFDVTAEDPPAGLAFELTEIFATVSAHRIILLFDRYRGNLELTLDLLTRIRRESPLARKPVPLIVVTYSSSSIGYLARATLGLWTGKSRIPLARRAAYEAGWDRPQEP